jgi:hypothetical protein
MTQRFYRPAKRNGPVRGAGRLRARRASWPALSLRALCVALAVVAVLLAVHTPPIPRRPGPNFQVLAGVPLPVYPTVGAFVASHRPKNPVDWILCGMASGRAGRDAGSKRDGMSLKRRGA